MNTPLCSGNADPIVSQLAASEIWRAYRDIEIKYLPRVAMGLAVFYTLLTLANVLFDDAAARLHLLLPTALLAVVLIALALYTRLGWSVLVWWASAAAQWLNATLAISAAVHRERNKRALAAARDEALKAARVEEALAFEDAPRVQRVAHALKGSAASLGAEILARGAAEIEIAARNEAISGVGERLANLRHEFGSVKATLKAELPRGIERCSPPILSRIMPS
jgi:HPt (histidine-containing phosphotransfer) domain-containing protein